MATKKTSATNKTAHVLNIISGENRTAPEGEDAAQTSSAPRTPVTPPILEVVKASDDALSEQIRAAMEADLDPAPEAPVSVEEAAPAPSVEVPAVEELSPAPLFSPAEEQSPNRPDDPVIPPTPRKEGNPTDLIYMNVMQALVEEKAERFIEMFGLCTCPRCLTDVKALALSNLPSKYVVMHRGDIVPMLTVYEGRYNAAVIAQLTQACRAVMKDPRHGR